MKFSLLTRPMKRKCPRLNCSDHKLLTSIITVSKLEQYYHVWCMLCYLGWDNGDWRWWWGWDPGRCCLVRRSFHSDCFTRIYCAKPVQGDEIEEVKTSLICCDKIVVSYLTTRWHEIFWVKLITRCQPCAMICTLIKLLEVLLWHAKKKVMVN